MNGNLAWMNLTHLENCSLCSRKTARFSIVIVGGSVMQIFELYHCEMSACFFVELLLFLHLQSRFPKQDSLVTSPTPVTYIHQAGVESFANNNSA